MRQFDPKECIWLPGYRGAYLMPSTADGKVGCAGPGKLDVRANHATRKKGLRANVHVRVFAFFWCQFSPLATAGSLRSIIHSTRPAFLPFFERMIDRVNVLISPDFLCGLCGVDGWPVACSLSRQWKETRASCDFSIPIIY